MGFTRKKSLHAGSTEMQLQKMTVVQLKRLHKDILDSPYGLKLQVAMSTRMTGALKVDYIQKILEMENRIQQFIDSNEPFEDEATDKVILRMKRAAESRKQRISNARRNMYDGMFGKFDAFMRGVYLK
jgi:hypothetical protein